MKGWQVNDEFGRMWMEAVVAKFYGTIPEFSWRNWERPQKTSHWIAGLRAENWTRDLPNTKQECWSLDHDVQYKDLYRTVRIIVPIGACISLRSEVKQKTWYITCIYWIDININIDAYDEHIRSKSICQELIKFLLKVIRYLTVTLAYECWLFDRNLFYFILFYFILFYLFYFIFVKSTSNISWFSSMVKAKSYVAFQQH
jgi:hypothetical protein